MEKNLNEKREGGFAVGLLFVLITSITIVVVISGFNRGCRMFEHEASTQVTTIQPQSESEEAPKRITGQTVYTVVAGDTLWDIAMEYCDGDLDLLYRMNPGIDELKFILPGDTIIIPTWE